MIAEAEYYARRILRSVVPEPLRRKYHEGAKERRQRVAILNARKAFENAPTEPGWLQPELLGIYQQEYSLPAEYSYDPDALEKRGKKRAKELLSLPYSASSGDMNAFLELGCGDGMVSGTLQGLGKTATAIDIDQEGFDERAIRQGALFKKMDASHLQFEDELFDVVFSYNGFEHFPEPDLALCEAYRVVKVGGYIYLSFAPLYMSPFGRHVYRVISVPYCHFLFAEEVLLDYIALERGRPANPPYVNKWPAEQFRAMWKQKSSQPRVVNYGENLEFAHVDLIEKHPACFKSKTNNFDNLVVTGIEVLFERIS